MWKLVVGDSFAMPELGAAVPGARLGPIEERSVEDVYYDTTGFRLARWGCTLRFRAGVGWTAKIPVPGSGLVLSRHEITFDAAPDRPPPTREALGEHRKHTSWRAGPERGRAHSFAIADDRSTNLTMRSLERRQAVDVVLSRRAASGSASSTALYTLPKILSSPNLSRTPARSSRSRTSGLTLASLSSAP